MIAARNTFAVFLLLAFTACSQLGLPTANTFSERLAVAYGTVTQVRTSATTLLQAKKITSDDAQNVQTQADNARVGLDIARKVSMTDPTGADAKLTAIRTILTGLSTYLAGKQ